MMVLTVFEVYILNLHKWRWPALGTVRVSLSTVAYILIQQSLEYIDSSIF